jgi:cilia- and flagella-associated protein 44
MFLSYCSDLQRLSQRIGELHDEIQDAKVSFKSLHREKVRLEKERGVQRKKIENWTEKCSELQMLKFGRLIDLDVLEQGSDRTKEDEAEATIAAMETAHQAEMHKLQKELNHIRQEYANVRLVIYSLGLIYSNVILFADHLIQHILPCNHW